METTKGKAAIGRKLWNRSRNVIIAYVMNKDVADSRSRSQEQVSKEDLSCSLFLLWMLDAEGHSSSASSKSLPQKGQEGGNDCGCSTVCLYVQTFLALCLSLFGLMMGWKAVEWFPKKLFP
jgi:hypothetical protein